MSIAQGTIFFIESDDDTRRLLKQGLRANGYKVLVAEDVEEALEGAEYGLARADLILLGPLGNSTEDALDLGRRIRGHAKHNGDTPLVVMAEKYGKDVEGTDVNAGGNDWIFYLGEDSGQLRNLLARVSPLKGRTWQES
jgi:DNA-binding response OmpR family regulator